MSNRRTQATIPEPAEDVRSLRTVALATKELVETLAGQRGSRDDQAVLWGEFPRGPLTTVIDQQWNPLIYLNGWADYGVPYSPAGFRKLSSGLVLMRGLVANGTAVQICQLPPGYRPGNNIMLFIAHHSAGFCRLDLDPSGQLTHSGGTVAWISLNNVCFLAEN